MKIQFLKSSTVVIESKGVKVLTDPWLVDGEYYGSWHHYPPYDFQPESFADIDFIFVSHIHPDHFSRATLSQLSRDIPVLIHKYNAPFLKRNLESLGFQVTELDHNVRTHLKDGLHINILAADDCNPELCQKFLGCGIYESKDGSTQIDSLAVFDDGTHTVVNVNDCPLLLARVASLKIQEQYQKIDFLLVGYAGAGPYPQCFPDMDQETLEAAAVKKCQQFLDQGLGYLRLFRPRYYLPFAGTYTLGGSLADRNAHRGVPELEDALTYFEQALKIEDFKKEDSSNDVHRQGMLLNSGSTFDLVTEQPSEPYIPLDRDAKQKYIVEVLADRKFSFEHETQPNLADLQQLVEQAYIRMDGVRTRLNFSSETQVLVPLVDGKSARISMKGEGLQIVEEQEGLQHDQIVQMKVDPKLLGQILKGPRFAHWNNAEIGSHIQFIRRPEKYERGLYYCMNFFHA